MSEKRLPNVARVAVRILNDVYTLRYVGEAIN